MVVRIFHRMNQVILGDPNLSLYASKISLLQRTLQIIFLPMDNFPHLCIPIISNTFLQVVAVDQKGGVKLVISASNYTSNASM